MEKPLVCCPFCDDPVFQAVLLKMNPEEPPVGRRGMEFGNPPMCKLPVPALIPGTQNAVPVSITGHRRRL